jgi:hypothetical protein
MPHKLPEDVAAALNSVNPGWGQTNCAWCVIAVEARLSGRRPTAFAPAKIDGALPHSMVLEQYYGAQFGDAMTGEAARAHIQSTLRSQGHGAQGIVMGGGDGLSHVWNAINHHGQILFIDGQRHTQFTLDLYFRAFPAFQFMPIPR